MISAAPPSLPTVKFQRWQGVGRDLILLFGVAAGAAAFGLGFNARRSQPLPWVYASRADRLKQSVARLAVTPTPSVEGGRAASPSVTAPAKVPLEMIDLDRFHALTQDPASIVLDARPGLFYRVGHVPGARALSREKFESDYAKLRSVLEANRQNTLAVYCAGGDCEDSRMVAEALQDLGYPKVVIYEGGWEEWQSAGLPEEKP